MTPSGTWTTQIFRAALSEWKRYRSLLPLQVIGASPPQTLKLTPSTRQHTLLPRLHNFPSSPMLHDHSTPRGTTQCQLPFSSLLTFTSHFPQAAIHGATLPCSAPVDSLSLFPHNHTASRVTPSAVHITSPPDLRFSGETVHVSYSADSDSASLAVPCCSQRPS